MYLLSVLYKHYSYEKLSFLKGCLQKAPPGPTRLLVLPRHLATIDPLSSKLLSWLFINPSNIYTTLSFLRAWLDHILLYVLIVPKKICTKKYFYLLFYFFYISVCLVKVGRPRLEPTLKYVGFNSEDLHCFRKMYVLPPPLFSLSLCVHKRHFPPV